MSFQANDAVALVNGAGAAVQGADQQPFGAEAGVCAIAMRRDDIPAVYTYDQFIHSNAAFKSA